MTHSKVIAFTLVSILLAFRGECFGVNIPIANSSYICSSTAESSSLFVRGSNGVLRSVSFRSAESAVTVKKKKLAAQIRSMRKRIAVLHGTAKTRAKKKLATLNSTLKKWTRVGKDILKCKKGTLTLPETCVAMTSVSIGGSTQSFLNAAQELSLSILPVNATAALAYAWSPEPTSGQGTASASYTWNSTGTKTISITVTHCGGTATDNHTVTVSNGASTPLVQNSDFVYQGAFRLPGGDTPPLTFAYGGNAVTFNPDGDSGNSDAFPGSLFMMGHERQAWGQLPNGNQVAEINIPQPVISSSIDALPTADFIQDFADVTAGYFTSLEEIPRIGMQYLNYSLTGPKIHLTWGQHMQPSDVPSQAWFNPTLSNPQLQGIWYLGDIDPARLTGYMLDIPASWADAYASGHYVGTGRYRDGGLSGMGPALFAYSPWQADGSAPENGTHLPVTTLLLYENAYNTDQIVRCLNGYQHADEWEGGAWLNTPSGKSALLFVGTKSNGAKYWYGYRNLAGSDLPCVYPESIGEFRACIQSDGTDCPAGDFGACSHTSERGWWSTHTEAEIILYNPADIAHVAAGSMQSWEPQPYASLSIDSLLYQNPSAVEVDTIGAGVQRRFKIGAAAYDREHSILYVLELYADGARPVVHVWKIN